jgi:hypothetical protein
MMTFPKRVLSMAAVLTALSSIASGYYHFVYFPGRTAPFNPVNLHFDLTQLTNNTVYFFISDQGPDVFVPGDSFTAVISELQLAAQAWNNIPSSQIKIAYGGLENSATAQSTPGIDVIFSDENIAAGILAQTKVTTYANVSFINNTTPFLPILRSQIQLRKNLTVTVPQQASFYDSSFTTMAHEFGHSLGLQHTLTSACMSTYITRSTTKAMPIVADDVAGISLLYPTPNYLATTGSITGQVTLSGSGVNLASVVAISPITGAAISNLTNPDGTYRIDAIPPGPAGNYYLVYVHPLPPPEQGEAGPDAIVLPLDSSENPFAPNTGFVTQFSPGTRDWTQAAPVYVYASSTSTVNFNVQASAGPAISGLELWGYLNNVIEASPMLPVNASYNMLFCAPGTTSGSNQLASGLNVSAIGSAAQIIPNYTKWYGNYNLCNLPLVLTGVWTQSVQSTTPVALAITVNSDLYVLPAAFFVVPSGAPTLTNLLRGVDANGNGLLTVYGSSLSQGTQFVFDGTPAVSTANGDGSFTLAVPPAPGPYNSSVEALNPDGQTSGQANPFGPPESTYNYSYTNLATIQSPSPSIVTPGTDAMIQINGSNTNFLSGQTTVGFGSSDIVVKQVFVNSPTWLIVNVSVNPQAPLTSTSVTVTTGLQTATLTLGMQIGPSNPNQISLRAPITNALTGLAGVPAGGTAVITATDLPQNLTGWTLNIGGQLAPMVYGNGQLQAAVPSGLGYGAQTVQLIAPVGGPIGPGISIPPIAMKIDALPPTIASVLSASGVPLTSSSVVHPGDVLTVNLLGISDPTIAQLTISNIFATLGAITGPGAFNAPVIQFSNPAIQVQIPYSAPTGTSIPFYVGVGTRVSSAVYLNIHN